VTADTAELDPAFAELIDRFDHFSIAVRDIGATASLVELMGGTPHDSGLSYAGDFRWAQYRLPGGKLELISAVDPNDEAHFINSFIATRGEGLHHLTFKVTDISAAVDGAVALGFSVFGFDDSEPGWKEAFVHPKSAHGVLIQLAEFADGSW
jgi:methylmalonyl-CoA/ethylmalonyl-CoA epimerase